MEICKILIESGYFFLADRGKGWFPHRRALWGNRVFLRGVPGTDWHAEALRFRDWLVCAQNWYTQVVRIGFWVLDEPLPNIRPQDMAWGNEHIVWDAGYGAWPTDAVYPSPPWDAYTGRRYRGVGYENVPFPPSVAYRWEKSAPTLGGRRHYGYLRCVERGDFVRSTWDAGACLPFFAHPGDLGGMHQRQIAEPLSRSGAGVWHQATNPVREVIISHRGGTTSVHEVTGYLQGIVMTTARNFSLPVI